MAKYLATRTRFENSSYPCLSIAWWEDDDQSGWKGTTTTWIDGNTKIEDVHTVSIRQGLPLGSIFVAVDECEHGAWSFASFEGVGITERDLQWAAIFAVEAIKRKQQISG